MKKNLVALAALASVSAFAQSSVEIYGIVDAAVSQVKVSGNTASSGDYDKAKNAKTTAFGDGTGTGRLGFRGTEDLGGGLKANFVAEAVMSLASGTQTDRAVQSGAAGTATDAKDSAEVARTTAFFGKTRQSFIGLSGGFGSANLGYKKTLETDVTDAFNLGNEAATVGGNAAHLTNRISRANGVYYTAPAINGVTISAQATPYSVSYADATKDGTSKVDVRLYELSAVYANGPLKAGAAYMTGHANIGSGIAVADLSGTGTPTFAAGNNDVKGYVLGASYKLNGVTLAGLIGKREAGLTSAANLTADKYSNLGVLVPVGQLDLSLVYNTVTHTDTDGATVYKTPGTQLNAKYNLSKRTAILAIYGTATKKVVGGDQVKTSGVQVGLTHSF